MSEQRVDPFTADAAASPITTEWRPVCVPAGTAYPDEPSETVEPGWWLLGGADPDAPDVLIHLGWPTDTGGADAGARLSARLTAALSEPDPEPTHTVSWFAAVWAALAGRAPRARCGAYLGGAPQSRPGGPCSACTAREVRR